MNLTKSEIVFFNSSRGNDSEKSLWRQESGVEFQRNIELFPELGSRHVSLRVQNDEVLNEFREKSAGTLCVKSTARLRFAQPQSCSVEGIEQLFEFESQAGLVF
ncbi:MAG: hypothetical protein JNL58_08570 [Planctomyces sp.]|nr:hypothetical protein [Planctomyces sp.]